MSFEVNWSFSDNNEEEEEDYDDDDEDDEVEDEMSTDDNWSFSDAGKKAWQLINGLSFGKIFRRKSSDKKAEAPEYWTSGTEGKIKDYTGWDLEW